MNTFKSGREDILPGNSVEATTEIIAGLETRNLGQLHRRDVATRSRETRRALSALSNEMRMPANWDT